MSDEEIITAAVKEARKLNSSLRIGDVAAHPKVETAGTIVMFDGLYAVLDCVTKKVTVPSCEIFDPNLAKDIAVKMVIRQM